MRLLMISIRQLLIVALLIVGFWLFRRLQYRFAAVRDKRTRRSPAHYQEMVRCTRCGQHIPKVNAIGDARSGYFCGDDNCSARDNAATDKYGKNNT